MVLEPTSEEDLIDLDYRESLVDYSHLVAKSATAATNLMPSGKADFNGQLVDVITEVSQSTAARRSLSPRLAATG